jgi:integrase
MTPKEARTARLDVRTAENPARERRLAKATALIAQAQTLRALGEAWLQARADNRHWSDKHRREVERRLARYVWPRLGDQPIAEITTAELEVCIRRIDSPHEPKHDHGKFWRGRPRLEATRVIRPAMQKPAPKQHLSRTAYRVKDHLRLIYAFAERRVPALQDRRNPIERLAQDLPSVVPTEHHAAARTIEAARDVLRAVEARAETLAPLGVLAHRFIALTAVRKEEALDARWTEFDLESALWVIPAERMKMKQQHTVPLSRQAVELLRVARQLSRGELVFASASGRVGARTLNNLMTVGQKRKGLGCAMVPHGWRTTFSTLMNEVQHGDQRDAIEAALAHAVPGVRGVYMQSLFLERRRPLMQAWADMLLPETAPTAAELVGVDAATNVVTLARVA